MDDLDIIKEFLIESDENLVRLDQEIIELETDPKNPDLIASIFRTIHTIKGTCGFLGFDILTEVSHAAESILSQVRDGKRDATQHLINIILEAIDAIKKLLKVIEETGNEGDSKFRELVEKLQAFAETSEAKTPLVEEVPLVQAGPADESKYFSVADAPAITQTVEISPAQIPSVSMEAESKSKGQESEKAAESTIRVGVGLLNGLMNLVGELVLARNQVLQFSSRIEDASLLATSQRLNLITSELQESVMKTRLQPIGTIWSKFPRVVRDIATNIHKQITLTMDGAETELDRTIIEAIKDPLTHIIRNSCDHGIEKPEDRVRAGKPPTGKLSLRAFHEGGSVNIEICDDGAGINPEKVKNKAVQKGLISAEQAARMSDREAINIIFLPGFSTAQQISNISGRGVGMDVVRTNIEKIGGTVDLLSETGQGTTLKIKIPLTLAIIPGLVVTSDGERFIIPQISLSELVRLEGAAAHQQLERIHSSTVYRRRGKLLPLTYLNQVLETSKIPTDEDVTNIVILQVEGHEFGLVVDAVNDTQEIVVKPLGKYLKGLTAYSGATIMGDGKVALILDVLGIAQRSGVLGENRSSRGREDNSVNATSVDGRETLLLFRAGSFERIAVPLNIVARLEEISAGKVERAAGQLVTQYRDRLLLLVPLIQHLDPAAFYSLPEGENVQVIVFKQGEIQIGLIVDSIVDILEEKITVKRKSKAPGLLGSVVIGQKVTDLLDLPSIITAAQESGLDPWGPATDYLLSESNAPSLHRLSAAVNDSEASYTEAFLTQ